MIDSIQILWNPTGKSIPSLGVRALVDVSDGDTPNIRMPIRMLSIDTPEVTARSEKNAAKIDEKFSELAEWIKKGIAPVSKSFSDYILHKIETGKAASLQFEQGKHASRYLKDISEKRLKREKGKKRRNLFIQTTDKPFDNYNRLLAYVSPFYSGKERASMPIKERATFNLNLVESGWAAPFILYPNIPGERDLPLFLQAALEAQEMGKGQYIETVSLPGYEYRMLEKLYTITKKIAEGKSLSYKARLAWRSRYVVDMRDRTLHGPEDYMAVPQPYRIWLWPQDVQEAIGKLNLTPKSGLVS